MKSARLFSIMRTHHIGMVNSKKIGRVHSVPHLSESQPARGAPGNIICEDMHVDINVCLPIKGGIAPPRKISPTLVELRFQTSFR
jgi:hypothetical protein